ncbi:uncharacterized protein LOC126818117 [Patella vulgata]|uniref:uncharacterized protein LOC126818117 n=1 Tax=Patella vulgata TaxID=6465 RepID=UPI00217F4F33|nr:uncharacterized protein LOC126818117 [Patella vulgata]
MAGPSGRISTSPSKQVLSDVRKHIQSGDAEKLFGDESFVLDFIKLLYEDSIDKGMRTELVLSLEEYGCLSLNSNSVEQVISSLVDIFNQNVNKEGRCNFCLQLIICFTTITIHHHQVGTSLGGNVISRLWNVIKNVNHVPSRRIRGCCCQSLIQLENSAPGILQKYKDELLSLVKQEKTHVGQDYIQLLSTVLQAALSKDDNGTKTEQEKDKAVVERSTSLIDSQELLPDISYIMENVALVTSAGLWSIIKSLTNILQSSTDISPSIFKQLILHHMATLDPMVFHLILYLQKEFEGEVLTSPEEQQLLLRLVTCVNHPLLSPAHRLLFVQWLKGYEIYGSEVKDTKLPEFVCHNYQDKFYPGDFDSLDLQVGKLSLLCSSKRQDQGEDFNTKLFRCSHFIYSFQGIEYFN